MDNESKLNKINNINGYLVSEARRAIKKNDYEKSLEYIRASAKLQYFINQKYTDDVLENMLADISEKIVTIPDDYFGDENTVIFYDGFGLDLRGLAITYTKAIAAGGFHLVYVIPENAKDKIPHILSELKGYNVDVIEVSGKSNTSKIDCLNSIFGKYHPKKAFFYTFPYDICATVVFNGYKDRVVRYQIDLADHAFWLGVQAVDYIINGRALGASIALYERKFRENQIKKLDTFTYINKDICDEPLPFDITKEKYIFSGGSLYKTLGDKELLYYKTVIRVLEKFSDIKFLYAGYGDEREMHNLQKRFPGRVFLIGERSDFYRLIEHCVFYLNTYPMFGGMMMRYAALACKLPMTLKHENDGDGILFNQDKLGIEFENYDSFINELELILTNDSYREDKEKGLYGSVLTEEVFNSNVKQLLLENSTNFKFEDIPRLDTRKFRKEYVERFKYPEDLNEVIFDKRGINLWYHFPMLFLKNKIIRIIRKAGIKDND